ncbi:MAG: hypothetical protein Kow00124_25300 [Anaerolineae bacterium]
MYDFTGDMAYTINRTRCDNGLTPLTINGALNTAAVNHSIDMAVNNFFDHRGSDGRYVSDRASAAGYSWVFIGENLAAGVSDVGGAFNLWWNSPGHRQNMMHPDFREMGLGVVQRAGTTYGWYWTLVLGSQGQAPASCSDMGF